MQLHVPSTAIGAALVALAFSSFAAGPMAVASGPTSGAASAPAPLVPLPHVPKKKPPAPVTRVDINNAGRKELMTLPGIGAVEADKIIANRPYNSKTELVTKRVLGTGPFVSLKNQVFIGHMHLPGDKQASKATATKAAGSQAGAPKAP